MNRYRPMTDAERALYQVLLEGAATLSVEGGNLCRYCMARIDPVYAPCPTLGFGDA